MAGEKLGAPLQEPPSQLPSGGENLFQRIKAQSKKAEEMGIKLVRLSIGQPDGYPLESAMEEAAKAILSKEQSMHEYQDNDSPGVPGFAKRFVQAHVNTPLEGKNVAYLPTPGTKPMLSLFSLACGGANRKLNISMMTDPGYPTPKDWAKDVYHHNVFDLPLNPENNFKFSVKDIPEGTDLVMINYPHNPSGQVATKEQLEELCAYSQAKGIRLVNDAAYIALNYTDEISSLTDVAVNYPGLAWVELFSSSKTLGNATGWRIGAAVGSPIFINDLAKEKGKLDSGFNAALAKGALFAMEHDKAGIKANKVKYEQRIGTITSLAENNGMELTVKPSGGLFALFKAPKFAFGEVMRDAEDFNSRLIQKGIVGVPFTPYIRFSGCIDVQKYAGEINSVLKEAKVSY